MCFYEFNKYKFHSTAIISSMNFITRVLNVCINSIHISVFFRIKQETKYNIYFAGQTVKYHLQDFEEQLSEVACEELGVEVANEELGAE